MIAPNRPATDFHSLEQAAECLRVLAHPQRLRIIQLLLADDYSVGELAEACGIPAPMASEHLRLMHRCGLLSCGREGRCVYYRVAEPHVREIMRCIERRFAANSR